MAPGLLAEAGGVGVVGVHDEDVLRRLHGEDAALGVDVVVKVRVLVEVVGGDVGDHGHVRADADAVQLEARELEHRDVVRAHLRHRGEQGLADVAAQIDVAAGGAQQLGDDGGRGGLAVRARDADGQAGAEAEKGLHLAGDLRAVSGGGDESRLRGEQPGGAENDVEAVEPGEIAPAKDDLRATGAVALRLGAEFVLAALVADGDGEAGVEQQLYQRAVAHADADHGHALIFKGRNVLIKGHWKSPHRLIISRPGGKYNNFIDFGRQGGVKYSAAGRAAARTRRKPVREESPGSTGQG